MGQKISTCLWFNMNAMEAIDYYAGIFDDVKIGAVDHYVEGSPGPAGEVVYVEFTMNGQNFGAINGGPEFTFNEAISLVVECKDQAEVDYFWEKLGAGGEYGPCGWLKDKFGLSWQITPTRLNELMRDPNKEKARAAFLAMLEMGKIDLAKAQAAFDAA